MAQIIDFVAKKKELENRKKGLYKANSKASADASMKESSMQKAASESESSQETKDDEKSSYDFDKIMKDNAVRRDNMNQKRFKDNESVKRSYRLKSKREPQT